MKIDRNKIQLAMASKEMTMQELIKKAKISSTTTTRINSLAIIDVYPKTAGKIAKALEMEIEDICPDH